MIQNFGLKQKFVNPSKALCRPLFSVMAIFEYFCLPYFSQKFGESKTILGNIVFLLNNSYDKPLLLVSLYINSYLIWARFSKSYILVSFTCFCIYFCSHNLHLRMSSSGWLPAASGLHTPEFLPGPHISDNQKDKHLKDKHKNKKGTHKIYGQQAGCIR